MKITTDYLRSLNACQHGIDAFKDLFPDGEAEFNSENFIIARDEELDVDWLLEHIDDQSVLVTLSNDEDYSVRCGVAWNRNTPSATLAKLSKDESYWVRRGVKQNTAYKGARTA